MDRILKNKQSGTGRQIKYDAFSSMNTLQHPYFFRKEGILSSDKNSKDRMYIFYLVSLARFNIPIIQMYRILRPCHIQNNQQILKQIAQIKKGKNTQFQKYPKHNGQNLIHSIENIRHDVINGEKYSRLLMEFLFNNVLTWLRQANIKMLSQISYQIFGVDYSIDTRPPENLNLLEVHERSIFHEIAKNQLKSWSEIKDSYEEPTYSNDSQQNQIYKSFYRNNLLQKLKPIPSKMRQLNISVLANRAKSLWKIETFYTKAEQRLITVTPYKPYSKQNIKNYITLADYFELRQKISKQRQKISIQTNIVQQTKNFGYQIITQLTKYHENSRNLSYYYKWLCPQNIMYENNEYFLSFLPPLLECFGLDKMPLSQEMMAIYHTPQMHPDYYSVGESCKFNPFQTLIWKFLILIDQFESNQNIFHEFYTLVMVQNHSHLLFDLAQKIEVKPTKHKVLKEIFLTFYIKQFGSEPKKIDPPTKNEQGSDNNSKIYKINRNQFQRIFWEKIDFHFFKQFFKPKQITTVSQTDQYRYYQLMEKFSSSLLKQIQKQAIFTSSNPIKVNMLKVYLLIISIIFIEEEKKSLRNKNNLEKLINFSEQYRKQLKITINNIQTSSIKIHKLNEYALKAKRIYNKLDKSLTQDDTEYLIQVVKQLKKIFDITFELEKSIQINQDRIFKIFMLILVYGQFKRFQEMQEIYNRYKSFKKDLSIEQLLNLQKRFDAQDRQQNQNSAY